jgi:octaprenyl-diphosphate synthase
MMPTTLPGADAVRRTLEDLSVGSEVREHVGDALDLKAWVRRVLEGELPRWLESTPEPAHSAALDLVALRPLLAMLSAGAVGGEPAGALPVAVAVELLHSATLLHDDVIDKGSVRRGRPTANTVWGNGVAILGGDFCYFSALDALVTRGDLDLLARVVDVSRELVGGELLQLQRRGRAEATDVPGYLEVARKKTGALFAFATWGGARCVGASAEATATLDRFGEDLGVAYQIVDDLLDLEGDVTRVGKALGHDLLEGTVTLPVLFAMQESPDLAEAVQRLLEEVREGGAESSVALASGIVGQVRASAGPGQARRLVRERTGRALSALSVLDDSPARRALGRVAEQLMGRVR